MIGSGGPPSPVRVYRCRSLSCGHEQENLSGACTVCRQPVELKSDMDRRMAQGVMWSSLGGITVEQGPDGNALPFRNDPRRSKLSGPNGPKAEWIPSGMSRLTRRFARRILKREGLL